MHSSYVRSGHEPEIESFNFRAAKQPLKFRGLEAAGGHRVLPTIVPTST